MKLTYHRCLVLTLRLFQSHCILMAQRLLNHFILPQPSIVVYSFKVRDSFKFFISSLTYTRGNNTVQKVTAFYCDSHTKCC